MRSMRPTADNFQTPARSASFLSKVTTPFHSRKRNLAGFSIDTDEPYRHYSPGDQVKGCVNINVDKAVNVTHLVICLHGFVKVFSNAKTPGQSVPRDGAPLGSNNRTGKKGAEYFGNGFASLFEDEVALCGQGRLLPGKYKFRFELELPLSGLPSSIDFERGTISYMLTATLTKPTTISPTMSCHWKIKVIESIDVARSQEPKRQMVSLEPVVKGTKSRSTAKQKTPTDVSQQGVQSLNDSPTSRVSGDPPQSPALSETSSTSATSSGGFNWQVRSTTSISKNVNGGSIVSDFSGAGGINATIEVLRGGCLPGDILPVQVSVNHTKAVKSLQGIIVTLYRLARVDTHPAIPLGHQTKDKKPEYEDYYPKSRTGLGGLSLSSAGSSRAFRQDLNQTFAPLMIDPRSLTAVVKTSLQVPEDLFPTISNVPGGMISFKYYVEVVVDLRGKLASQDRMRSQLGIVNGAGGYGHGDPKVNGIDGSSGLFFPLASGFGCLDTSQVRRDKSVVSWPFEVIIGTRDSDRKRCKPNDNVQRPGTATSQQAPTLSVEEGSAGNNTEQGPDLPPDLASPYRSEPDGFFNIPQHIVSSPQYSEAAQTTMIPPPEAETADEDEKARLRRAEQRLLPSEPPVDEELGTSAPIPSAPEAIDSEDFIYRYRMHQPRSFIPSLISRDSIGAHSRAGNVVMDAEPSCATSSGPSQPNCDKQELELRRLHGQASSPEADEGPPNLPEHTAPVPDGNPSDEAYGPRPSIQEDLEGENLPIYSK